MFRVNRRVLQLGLLLGVLILGCKGGSNQLYPVSGKVTRGSANIAWMPSEFSFVRLEYSHAKTDDGIHPTDDRLMVQMSYTIGYHPAHAY